MKAMLLRALGALRDNPRPLTFATWPDPVPAAGELLVRVTACGVCHTELDEIEGRTPPPRLPVIPGHQVVGRVAGTGAGVRAFVRGDRVGVAWIFSACGRCEWCRAGLENLCPDFRATGRDAHGGYAEYLVVPEGFAHPIPPGIGDIEAAPLLCAGAIGYRALRLSGLEDGRRLGLTGFGASAHLVLKMVRHRFPASDVFVFARSAREREFARELGAVWTGDTEDSPPARLHAIIDTTPVWRTVVAALRHLEPAGRLVVNAIRKEDGDKEALLEVDYATHLWEEKEVKSVANVARRDVREFLELAAEMALRPAVETFPLEGANEALLELKNRRIRGAKVLRID
ncbi:MAG: zinc-dependent alcohol dehydrogenase family protein [Planctomycetes bacterium]|nr:zinc-dependent alcohol dehydrogenase family protein [Planctomycetota bacterium]